MLHNQVSYSVSPEYFTQLKFPQFGLLAPEIPDRLRAALVGFLASWWIGLGGGLFLGVSAWVFPGPQMGRAARRAIVVALMVTAIFPLAALAWSFVSAPATDAIRLMAEQLEVKDLSAFARAAQMHRAAYVGALFGLVAGRIWLMASRSRSHWSRLGRAPAR